MNKKEFISDVKAIIKVHLDFLLMPLIVSVAVFIALGALLHKSVGTLLHLKCIDWVFKEFEV